MAGWAIYNGFWNPDTPPDPVERLCRAAKDRGWTLTPVPNTSLIVSAGGDGITVEGIDRGDTVLFWDKDVRLGQALASGGVRVHNPVDAIAVCDDKSATHLALAAARVPMPRTLIAPMTYREIGPQIAAFLRRAEAELGFPMVVKECYGSLGGQVYLARTPDDLRALAMKMGDKPFLAQAFLPTCAGEDHRLYVVGDRVVAAMHRRGVDFRSNIGGGGRGEAYLPTPAEETLALRCCRVLGLEFAGVDLLWDDRGEALVCEVNSNAFMAGITACTGVDVADEIVRYVMQKDGLA
ncbi:MAG: ATP-grasp domain-containing protein [Acutalibacteraceae bacterium]